MSLCLSIYLYCRDNLSLCRISSSSVKQIKSYCAFLIQKFLLFSKNFKKNINLISKIGGIILLITGVLILTNQLQTINFYIIKIIIYLILNLNNEISFQFAGKGDIPYRFLHDRQTQEQSSLEVEKAQNLVSSHGLDDVHCVIEIVDWWLEYTETLNGGLTVS